MVKLTKEDEELISKAKSLVNPIKHSEQFESGSVGCALITDKGNIFMGVCLDLSCAIGGCAEHTTISQMITNNETKIKTIVACSKSKIMYPCGKCREMIQLINKNNREDTEVITSDKGKVKLKEILPGEWY